MYERIKQLCKEHGISVNKLEQELEIARGSLCKMNSSKPSVGKAQKIADYFGVTVDYLMNGEENIKAIDEDGNIVVIDEETRDLIDSLRKKPEMKMLFSVSKKATKEDIIKAVKIIEALKEGE